MANAAENKDVDLEVYKLTDDIDVIENIERKAKSWHGYWEENNNRYRQCYDFVMAQVEGGSGQWNGQEVRDFEERKRVYLTVNRLYSDIQQIVGEQQQNSVQPHITSLSNDIDQKQIALREGLLRYIAYSSRSDIAYQLAFKCALCGGFGAIRIVSDYEDTESFNQELKILPIKEPTLCYWDVAANELDKTDGQYCGCYTTISVQEFKELYPDEDVVSVLPPSESGEGFKWYDGKRVTILEHFERHSKKTKLHLLSNGETVLDKDLKDKLSKLRKERRVINKFAKTIENDPQLSQLSSIAQEQITILDTRETVVEEIWHYKITGKTFLEKTLFHGKYLPIVFVDGDSYWKAGRQITRPYTLFAEDVQRLNNYVFSDMAQRLKTSHHGKMMGTIGQIPASMKKLYTNPELPQAYLAWEPDPRYPTLPPPQFIPPPELPASILNIPVLLENLTQAILGRYAVNRGGSSGEVSGTAISARVKQGNIGTFVYFNNLNRAAEKIGIICLNMMPFIYTTERQVMTTNKDGTVDKQKYNFNQDDSSVKYNLTVSVGSPYEVQKGENAQQLVMTMQALANNPLTPIMGDLVVENLTVENTPQIVKRFKDNVVNPQIIAKETGQQLPPPKPDPMQQQMAQIQQMKLQAEQMKAQADMMEAQAKMHDIGTDSNVTQTKANAEIGKAQLDYAGKLVEHHTGAKVNQLFNENQQLKQQLAQHQNVLNTLLSNSVR